MWVSWLLNDQCYYYARIQLFSFFSRMTQLFSRLVNLSECIEVTWFYVSFYKCHFYYTLTIINHRNVMDFFVYLLVSNSSILDYSSSQCFFLVQLYCSTASSSVTFLMTLVSYIKMVQSKPLAQHTRDYTRDSLSPNSLIPQTSIPWPWISQAQNTFKLNLCLHQTG